MFMSHEPSDQVAQSAAAERCVPSARTRDRDGRCRAEACRQVCIVETASLSLSGTSCRHERFRSCRGTDGGHYIQTPGEHRACPSRIRAAQWTHPRANRHTGAGRISRPLSTWVSDIRVAPPCTFSSTTASQTAALIELARTLDVEVPKAWIFEDEGYSGATLERPGLERVRDLAAEGQIQAVLIYSPDRLSRKYAYQVLLIEELARHGVETRFLNAPPGATAEDQLLVQFQGMIAEYERARILERSRRGKRHRARAGEISVLSGAPYGYRYLRKSDDAPASYTVIDAEARVVRQVYEHYTMADWSIG